MRIMVQFFSFVIIPLFYCKNANSFVHKNVRKSVSFRIFIFQLFFLSLSKRLKSHDKRPILGCIGFHSCKSLDAGKVLGPFLVSSSFCTQYQKWIFQRSNQAFFCNVMHLHTENCFHFIFCVHFVLQQQLCYQWCILR